MIKKWVEKLLFVLYLVLCLSWMEWASKEIILYADPVTLKRHLNKKKTDVPLNGQTPEDEAVQYR